MRVVSFMNWLYGIPSNYVVKTDGRDRFIFVVNKLDGVFRSLDTRINFEGGISVRELINYIARHNLEAYMMYNSIHGDVYFHRLRVSVYDREVYVQ